jgi:hypothetical protein
MTICDLRIHRHHLSDGAVALTIRDSNESSHTSYSSHSHGQRGCVEHIHPQERALRLHPPFAFATSSKIWISEADRGAQKFFSQTLALDVSQSRGQQDPRNKASWEFEAECRWPWVTLQQGYLSTSYSEPSPRLSNVVLLPYCTTTARCRGEPIASLTSVSLVR